MKIIPFNLCGGFIRLCFHVNYVGVALVDRWCDPCQVGGPSGTVLIPFSVFFTDVVSSCRRTLPESHISKWSSNTWDVHHKRPSEPCQGADKFRENCTKECVVFSLLTFFLFSRLLPTLLVAATLTQQNWSGASKGKARRSLLLPLKRQLTKSETPEADRL